MASRRVEPILQYLRRTMLRRDETGLTDGQLLERFLSGDEAAFEALVRRHGQMVLGVCRRIVGDAHDADDCFQATFLVLVRKAASIVPRDKVGPWLYGIARTTAVRVKAARAKRQRRERDVSKLPDVEALGDGLRDEIHSLLDEELARLPEKYRTPIVLCDLEGRTRKDVARQLKIPEGTLSSRLTTARRMLAARSGGVGWLVGDDSDATGGVGECAGSADEFHGQTSPQSTEKESIRRRAVVQIVSEDSGDWRISVRIVKEETAPRLETPQARGRDVELEQTILRKIVERTRREQRNLARHPQGRIRITDARHTLQLPNVHLDAVNRSERTIWLVTLNGHASQLLNVPVAKDAKIDVKRGRDFDALRIGMRLTVELRVQKDRLVVTAIHQENRSSK